MQNDVGRTILIVEDNPQNMRMFHDLLEYHGYNDLQATGGRQAYQLACDHRPDLILMDIQLPDASGVDVLKWIREKDDLKEIPVIAVTAFAMRGDENKMLQAGFDAYLSKPISVNRFIETVECALQ